MERKKKNLCIWWSSNGSGHHPKHNTPSKNSRLYIVVYDLVIPIYSFKFRALLSIGFWFIWGVCSNLTFDFETFALGVYLQNLLISAKKTIAMVTMDLDNVHNMVSNISKFATIIFVDLFNYKGKEENITRITIRIRIVFSRKFGKFFKFWTSVKKTS